MFFQKKINLKKSFITRTFNYLITAKSIFIFTTHRFNYTREVNTNFDIFKYRSSFSLILVI